ncbi:hypothetical protein G6N05_06070 [Flavobacterium sp. F372]|uniref:Glycosyltransferase RgtA/B/C/D-like domain-containing protein n=1 Tax=Flavobacterium bernardetii TaxID=2813823 RepID=A0ABR7IZV9_9FLAO|nr:hypothetical protein [Flavobacterium bernardetii]MBC5835329.1 hypothetical protein [Flavobacterium bernardetii]NHF69674.1 hypothetical protein [Flavobacterium bernardetii]
MFFNCNSFSKQEKRVLAYIGLFYFLFMFFRILSGNYFLADSHEYLEVAKLINNLSYFENTSEIELTTKRPFVYPFFLSFFVNFPIVLIIGIQTIISFFSVFIFFKILKKLEVKISNLLVVILFLTPSIFIYSQLIMSEWIVLLLINILTLVLLEPFCKRNFIIIQVITVLLAFTKPVFYPFIYINFLFFAYYLFKNKTFSFWLFFPVIILQLYLFHNEQKSGFKHFSSIENYNLINYNLYYFKASKLGKKEADKWHKEVYENKNYVDKSFKEQNIYLKNVGFNEIKNNFFSYSFYHLKTAIRGVFDPGRFDIMTFFDKEDGKQGFLEILNGNKSIQSLFKDKMIIIIILLIPIFFINIFKYFYFFKHIAKHKYSNLILYLFILFVYNFLISGPVNSSRYMMPFQLIVIGFALKEFQKNLLHPSNS